jgi:Ca-activated chloride channel family protein
VTTSTYGLGRHFNEELMIGMARHGLGSAYYGRTVDDLMDPFREEFALLNAMFARRPRLEVEPAAGVDVAMLNDYVTAEDGGWWLPDLAYAGEAWAVVRLKVRAPATSAAGSDTAATTGATEAPIALASFALRYATPDGEPRAIQPVSLALPALPAAAFHAIAEDELVARRAGELEAARIQTKARQAAARGDWHEVAAALQQAESAARDNAWVQDSLAELRSLAEERDATSFAKESAFAARKMSTRLAACDELQGAYDAPAKAEYLRRKSSQGKGEPKPRGS